MDQEISIIFMDLMILTANQSRYNEWSIKLKEVVEEKFPLRLFFVTITKRNFEDGSK